MIISLIGISGCGKSHWAKRLEKECGLKRYCCDDVIEEKLGSRLQSQNFKGITSVAHWLGHPYHDGFAERQAEYLSCEIEVSKELHSLVQQESSDTVIDTSGSVIYTGEESLKQMREISKVAYLQVPEERIGEMFQQYLKQPKPLIWNDVFQREAGESLESALERCYFTLFTSRAKMYEEHSDVVIRDDFHGNASLSAKDLLRAIVEA